MHAREKFPHPYKECFVLLPDRCGISQLISPAGPSVLASTLPRVHPLRGSASLLAHRRPVSSSDTIYNCPNSRLVNIVFFELSRPNFLSRFLKRVYYKVSHPYKKYSVLPQFTWYLTHVLFEYICLNSFDGYTLLQMRCKDKKLCSTAGTKLILTDLNLHTNRTDLVLSKKAFSALAQKGQHYNIFKRTSLEVEYKRLDS